MLTRRVKCNFHTLVFFFCPPNHRLFGLAASQTQTTRPPIELPTPNSHFELSPSCRASNLPCLTTTISTDRLTTTAPVIVVLTTIHMDHLEIVATPIRTDPVIVVPTTTLMGLEIRMIPTGRRIALPATTTGRTLVHPAMTIPTALVIVPLITITTVVTIAATALTSS